MERELINLCKWRVHRTNQAGNVFRVMFCHTEEEALTSYGKFLLTLDGEIWIETPEGEIIMRVVSCQRC